jgi:AraC-like DNA-binding protein
MAEYAKTKVENVVAVKSIATALHVDLRSIITREEFHSFPEIFYMSQDQGMTVVDGKRIFLKAGQMVIYAPNAPHGGGSGGVARIISFETESPLPASLFNQPITLTGPQRMLLEEIIAKAMSLLERRVGVHGMALKYNADSYALQRVKNMLELFLLELMRPGESPEESRLRTVTDYMIRHMAEPVTLQKLCDDLGFSTATLKRLTQKCCHQSPIAYFQELKIAEAQRLIADTPFSMTQIAAQLGYSSVHHFSKTFKQKTALTPTEYAKTVRK